MKKLIQKQKRLIRRKRRIRAKVSGTPERPRVSVYRSNRHLFVQAIDDTVGKTLLSAGTTQAAFKGMVANVAGGEKLGEAVGAQLKEKNITVAVLDRNGRRYHGVIKAVADGVRKAGIQV
jgi:large subunit ribosomal protein L18